MGPKSAYWAQTDQSWWLAVAGFGALVFFILMLILSRFVIGPKAFRFRRLTGDQVEDGTEQDQGTEDMGDRPLNRAIHFVLNIL